MMKKHLALLVTGFALANTAFAASAERLLFDVPPDIVKQKEESNGRIYVSKGTAPGTSTMFVRSIQKERGANPSDDAMLYAAIAADECPGSKFGSIAKATWGSGAGVMRFCPSGGQEGRNKGAFPWTFAYFLRGAEQSYLLAVNYFEKPSSEEAKRLVSLMNSVRICPANKTDSECRTSAPGSQRVNWNDYLVNGTTPITNIGVVERSADGVSVTMKPAPQTANQPQDKVGCFSMKDVTNKMSPPVLYAAARSCVDAGRVDRAIPLLATADDYATYDLKRLADKTTASARGAVVTGTFSGVSTAEMTSLQNRYKAFQADPTLVAAQCDAITRLGPPAYVPTWAINHGMAMFLGGANKDPYLPDVDSKALWNDIVKRRCTPRSAP